MIFLRILHVVSGILGVFHGFCAVLLDLYFAQSKPTTPNHATGETHPWDVSDDDSWANEVVYITDYEADVWHAAVIVAAAGLLISAATYLILKLDARRNGRTSIF